MQVIEKHGGASHYMRPDRVYRTGVLSPSMNFSPGQDVEAVTAEFTERSPNLSGPRTSGPSYVPRSGPGDDTCCERNLPCCWDVTSANSRRSAASSRAFAGLFGPTAKLGFMERMRLRFDAWRARMFPAKAKAIWAAQDAQDAQNYSARAKAFLDNGVQGMADAQVGERQAPHMMGQLRMLAHLSSSSMPKRVADAQVATSMEHWNNLRWNG